MVFFTNLIIELFKNININKNNIELIEDKKLSYQLIYSLNKIELKTLKTYIEFYLKTEFIYIYKFYNNVFIIFNKNSNNNLYLYINY